MFGGTVKSKLEKANFISILGNCLADSAVIERECIYVLFVNNETFLPTIYFFSLRNIPYQDAEVMFSVTKKAFTDKGPEFILDKIVFEHWHKP